MIKYTDLDNKKQSEVILTNPEQGYLSDFSKKDEKWDYHRGNTQAVEVLYQDGSYTRLAERMTACSSFLGYAWQTDKESGESNIKLRSATFCKVRHCPVCQWRRSMRNVARFFSKIPDLETLYPKHRWIFLTLTVPNCRYEDLRTTIADMNKAWKRLIQLKGWPAVGFIRTTEVTREQGRNGYAHPHFHCLLMVPPSYFSHGYIKHSDWLEMWQQCMRDPSITSVNIKTIKGKEKADSLHAAVVETLKYATKVEDVLGDPDFLYAITDQLHKMRFLATGGVLKDLLKDEVTDKEMIVGEETEAEAETEKEEPSLFFGWKPKERRYKLV